MRFKRAMGTMSVVLLCATTAGAMTIHYDHNSAPLEASVSITAWSSTLSSTTLPLELIPGMDWSHLHFTAQGRKYTFSTPYGPGQMYEGVVTIPDASISIIPTTSTWKFEAQRYGTGTTIDASRQFVSDHDYGARLVYRVHRVYAMGDAIDVGANGDFLSRTLYGPPPVSGYLGFRLTNDEGEYHYGWMKAETYITDGLVRLRVFEWAYEFDPNTAVVTGNTGPSPSDIPANTVVNQPISPTQMVCMADGLLSIYANGPASATVIGVFEQPTGSPAWWSLRSHGFVEALFDIQLSGLADGESVALMFDITDHITDELQVWHIDDTGNTHLIDPTGWRYDGDRLVIDAVSDFSVYGITIVPEPMSGLLLASAVLLLIPARRATRWSER